jgi:hypothetical protein
MTEEDRNIIERNVDEFGDSYCRDITTDGLKKVMKKSLLKILAC